jgi:hypothetical protein
MSEHSKSDLNATQIAIRLLFSLGLTAAIGIPDY